MAKSSSTYKRRRKKYQLLQDFSHLDVDIVTPLEEDDGTLVKHTLTTNTHGGKNKLWRFDDLEGEVATVSTKAIDYEKTKYGDSLPVYKHFVLTDEGLAWIKGVLLENATL